MRAELRKAINDSAQEFAKYGSMKASRVAKMIKNICRGVGGCEGCPFFVYESEYLDCMLLALAPDH